MYCASVTLSINFQNAAFDLLSKLCDLYVECYVTLKTIHYSCMLLNKGLAAVGSGMKPKLDFFRGN